MVTLVGNVDPKITTEYYSKEISISFWVGLNNFHVQPLCFKFLAPKQNP